MSTFSLYPTVRARLLFATVWLISLFWRGRKLWEYSPPLYTWKWLADQCQVNIDHQSWFDRRDLLSAFGRHQSFQEFNLPNGFEADSDRTCCSLFVAYLHALVHPQTTFYVYRCTWRYGISTYEVSLARGIETYQGDSEGNLVPAMTYASSRREQKLITLNLETRDLLVALGP